MWMAMWMAMCVSKCMLAGPHTHDCSPTTYCLGYGTCEQGPLQLVPNSISLWALPCCSSLAIRSLASFSFSTSCRSAACSFSSDFSTFSREVARCDDGTIFRYVFRRALTPDRTYLATIFASSHTSVVQMCGKPSIPACTISHSQLEHTLIYRLLISMDLFRKLHLPAQTLQSRVLFLQLFSSRLLF